MQSQRKRNIFDLTEGGILKKLLLVALPVIFAQIIQMTYNLTDMYWLGRVGSSAVAASGSVGMFLWLSMAFAVVGAKGAEIGVSQNLGRGDLDEARAIGQSALTLATCLGLGVALVMIIANKQLIGIFNLTDPQVARDAEEYLVIVCFGLPFSFTTMTMTGIFNGRGNSIVPFCVNGIGLAVNMILDPLFILRYGMGVRGAAYATVIAQIIACTVLGCVLVLSRHRPIEGLKLFRKPRKEDLRQILRWTLPIAIESLLFTALSMITTRFIASYGTSAMAASRVGSQVESLSWLIAGGFSSALTAFVGQNYGARKWDRIHRGLAISTRALAVYGVLITAFLYFGARAVYGVFLPNEPDVIAIGVTYLQILACCQLLACLEAVASGAFRGVGRTTVPSIISIATNASRVVLAYILMRTPLGLNGVFWSITIGAAARGLWMYLAYMKASKKFNIQEASECI